jgi:hypothetical protein
MLMVSRFDGYCHKCGFPVFEGDVFDYQPNTPYRAQCVKCFKEVPPESPCPHYAVWTTADYFTPSNRHRHTTSGTRKHIVHCCICQKEFNNVPEKAVCVKTFITSQHGASYPSSRMEFEASTSSLQRQKHLIKTVASVIQVMLLKHQFPDTLITEAYAQIDRLIELYQSD